MKFILFFFMLGFSFNYAQSQSKDSQEEIQALIQRVDSLEHEFLYLKLTSELFQLDSEIATQTNEVYSKCLSIRIDINRRDFNLKLGKSYQQYYESCQHLSKELKKKIDIYKKAVILQVLSHPFQESESDIIMSRLGLIDGKYDSLMSSMDLLKTCVNAYQDYLWAL